MFYLDLREAGEGVGDGIDVAPWLESPVDLLAPAGHPTVPRDGAAVDLEALAGQPLVVLQRGSAFRRHLESAFAARGLELRPAVEVGNLSLVRRFVIAGLGIAPVPSVAFSSSGGGRLVRGVLHDVPPVRYSRAVRAGAPLPSPVTDLLEHLKP